MNAEQPSADIATRKAEHIDLVLNEDVEFHRSAGFDRIEFVHEALPDLSLDELDLSTQFLGRPLAAPLVVSGMTGGTERAAEINRRIAAAVASLGLGMGVGSQRILAERPAVLNSFQVRSLAPNILLIANLGAVQLNYGFAADDCRRLIDSIGADALALHLNPLQEAIQPGGNTEFRGLLGKIAEVCRRLGRPVIVKEIGCGISGPTARRLVEAGVSAIDVGGAGGTCWTDIEGRRSTSPETRAVAATFREWGIPTADAIRAVRDACPTSPIIASGGLRNGLDIAKSLALGADLAAVAGPVLKAAVESSDAARELLSRFIRELRLAMFCTGSPRPTDLRRAITAEAIED